MIEKLLTRLRSTTPFDPFCVKLVNGDRHDVVYADPIVLMDEGVYIAAQDGTWAEFPYRRVASVESLLA